jgi:hypothetical protein
MHVKAELAVSRACDTRHDMSFVRASLPATINHAITIDKHYM